VNWRSELATSLLCSPKDKGVSNFLKVKGRASPAQSQRVQKGTIRSEEKTNLPKRAGTGEKKVFGKTHSGCRESKESSEAKARYGW
jgi:hypothetical protein